MTFADTRILMTAQRSSGDEFETLYIFYEPLEGREVSRYTPEKELRGILGCYADGEFSFLGRTAIGC